MKRITFVLFAFICASSILSFAQVKVDSGNPSINLQVKRAIAQGDDVYIDLVFTSSTSKYKNLTFDSYPAIFDDEGNKYGERPPACYHYDNYSTTGNACLDLEADVPRKLRIQVKNVDEYASSFVSVKVGYFANPAGWITNESVKGTLTIKNLPITR